MKKDDGDESKALQLVTWVIDQGIEGQAPGMCSAVELAQHYLNDSNYKDNDERIDSLVNYESSKTFATGFVTGLGGLVTLPVSIPAGLASVWIVQARMVGTIAYLRGYDLDDDRVRTVVLAALVGDSTVREVVKQVGNDFAMRAGKAAVSRVPGRVLMEINKKVGFRLLTKAGEKGVVNLMKVVPVLGGVVGGTVDAVATRGVGNTAKNIFRPRPDDGRGGIGVPVGV